MEDIIVKFENLMKCNILIHILIKYNIIDTVKWSILGGNLLTNRANQSALIVNDIVILYGGFQL